MRPFTKAVLIALLMLLLAAAVAQTIAFLGEEPGRPDPSPSVSPA